MEPSKLDPATDTAAEKQLADFLANQRHAPSILVNPFDELAQRIASKCVETPEQAAVREANEAQRALRQERARRQGELAKLIQSAGNRYADCTLANYRATAPKQREALKAVGEYIDLLRDAWESTGLVLYGPVGTGKDHLAMAVARVAIDEIGKRAAWVNGQTWFGNNRDSIERGITEAAAINALATPDLLVLSDPLPPAMGKGDELTPYQASMLYRLIDARYSRGQITIVTLNVNDDDEADRRLGEATWDRINHGVWKIHCDWPTYRKPAREFK